MSLVLGLAIVSFQITLKDPLADSFMIHSTNGCNERYSLAAGEGFADETQAIQVSS